MTQTIQDAIDTYERELSQCSNNDERGRYAIPKANALVAILRAADQPATVKESQPAAPAVGERDLPNETGLWMRDGTRWDLLFRGEWAIGWHEDTPIRCSHVEHFPRGGWSKAVPSAEIDRLRAECDCWRSKYEAALHDWRNTQTERDSLRAKLAEAEAKVGELKEPWSMSRGPNGEVVFSRGPERLCIWDDGQVEFLRFDGARIVERYEIGKIELKEPGNG